MGNVNAAQMRAVENEGDQDQHTLGGQVVGRPFLDDHPPVQPNIPDDCQYLTPLATEQQNARQIEEIVSNKNRAEKLPSSAEDLVTQDHSLRTLDDTITFLSEEQQSSAATSLSPDILNQAITNIGAGAFVTMKQAEHTKLQRERIGLRNQKFQQETSREDERRQQVTPGTLYNQHIIQENAHASLNICSTIVSGIKGSGKTPVIHSFINQVVKTTDEGQEKSLFDGPEPHCLACHRLIIQGLFPYKNLTWLMPKTPLDDSVMCLLSYFTSLCKKRDLSPGTDYHRLLDFVLLPASDDVEIHQEPEIADQVKKIFSELKRQWEQLQSDVNAQAILPNAVSLVNVFDVGHCKAAQDLLPFINKYCTHALKILCFSREEHEEVLKAQFSEGSSNMYEHQSIKCQLLRQLCGIHENNPIALTAIGSTQNPNDAAVLTEALKKEIEVTTVRSVSLSCDRIEEAKALFEQTVIEAPFYIEKPIKYMLLLQLIMERKQSSNSFWMKRKQLESLSKFYKFQNSDLEDFLQFFTSYGRIFYTHDIPALKEFVIIDVVKFVDEIHDLYHSNEKTAKYGLFAHKNKEDSRVIFQFLTTLGIATEVKSNQILEPQGISLETATTYYFIPTSRYSTSPRSTAIDSSLNVPTACDLLKSDAGYTHTQENLQACVCKHLLFNKSCFLIPTREMDTMAIRFHDQNQKQHDIKFIDTGNQLVMQLMEQTDSLEVTDAFTLMLNTTCPFFKRQSLASRHDLMERLKLCNSERRQGSQNVRNLMRIAKRIAKQDKMKKETLFSKLGKEYSWKQTEHPDDEEEWEEIFVILNENKGAQLSQILQEFDQELVN